MPVALPDAIRVTAPSATHPNVVTPSSAFSIANDALGAPVQADILLALWENLVWFEHEIEVLLAHHGEDFRASIRTPPRRGRLVSSISARVRRLAFWRKG